jgi:hypothetical protein
MSFSRESSPIVALIRSDSETAPVVRHCHGLRMHALAAFSSPEASALSNGLVDGHGLRFPDGEQEMFAAAHAVRQTNKKAGVAAGLSVRCETEANVVRSDPAAEDKALRPPRARQEYGLCGYLPDFSRLDAAV